MWAPISYALAFAAGTALLLLCPAVPGAVGWITLSGFLLLAIGLRWRVLVLAGWILLGFAWAASSASERVRRIDASLHNSDRLVTGVVTGLVARRGTTLSFQLRAALPLLPDARIAVRWYERDREALAPAPGERWQLNLRLRRPYGLRNPGSGGFERYAFRHGLVASAYVRAGDNRRVAPVRRPGIDHLRHTVATRIARELGQRDATGLIVALAVGDRQHLESRHWLVLRRAGLSHLMAISGLHVGMVALTAYWIGALCGSLVNRGIGGGCICAIAVAALYALLAGLPIPTLRALAVVVVFVGARWARRAMGRRDGFALALLAVLVVDPLAMIDAGFWLSFGAVAALTYVTGARTGGSGWRAIGVTQSAVAIGLAPLVLLVFGELSLVAPLVNLVALPVAGLLLVPGVLLGTVLLLLDIEYGLLPLRVLAVALDAAWPVLEGIAGLAFASTSPGAPPWLAIVSGLAGACWLLAPPGWPARWLGLFMCAGLWLSRPPAPAAGALEMTVLDVGHGVAIVVQTAHHVLVYDPGPAWRGGGDAGARVVLPYLAQRRVRNVDRIIVSHADSDHAGGAATLSEAFPRAQVLAGEPDGLATGALPCRGAERWSWDEIGFSILHPRAGDIYTGNDASCVLRIDVGPHCLLLTGDIEARAERALLAADVWLRCQLVLVPHHGSETSSHRGFVAATQPRVAVVSTAFANRWGFPRPAVVARWQAAGAQLLDTGRDGAIRVRVDRESGLQVETERCRRPRIWFEPCRVAAGAAALGRD